MKSIKRTHLIAAGVKLKRVTSVYIYMELQVEYDLWQLQQGLRLQIQNLNKANLVSTLNETGLRFFLVSSGDSADWQTLIFRTRQISLRLLGLESTELLLCSNFIPLNFKHSILKGSSLRQLKTVQEVSETVQILQVSPSKDQTIKADDSHQPSHP